MKLKTTTLLAIFGSAGLALTFALDWIFTIMGVTMEFYEPFLPVLYSINLLSRIFLMIFFIALYKNQK